MLWYAVGMKKQKSPKQIERHMKGIANHYRIAILLLIADYDGISLDGIVTALEANPKTIGEHTRRLCAAGLVDKKYQSRFVAHSLSPYGKLFVRFVKGFQNIS